MTAIERGGTPRSSIRVTNAHSAAEASNDVEKIMPTISDQDIQFVLVSEGRDGLTVRESHDIVRVRDWYESNRQSYELLAGAVRTRQIATSWYRFHEVLPQITHIGAVEEGRAHPAVPAPGTGGTHGDGRPYWMPVCVLFPTATDGIIGELTVWQFDMVDVFSGLQRPWPAQPSSEFYLDGAEIHTAGLHQRFVAAWRDHDVDRMTEVFDDSSYSLLRVVDASGDRRDRVISDGKTTLRSTFAGPHFAHAEDIEVISLLSSYWYLFAEYDLVVEIDGERRRRRLAAVYPVGRAGRFLGQLAYGIDDPEE